MVLDFTLEAMKNRPYDEKRINETLAWLNSMLCDKRQEVKTIEESIFWIERLLDSQNKEKTA